MTRLLAVLAASLALVVADAPAVPVAPPPREVVHYFPTRVGACWTYQGLQGELFKVVVTKVERKGSVRLVTTGYLGQDGKTTPAGRYEVSDQGLLQVGTNPLSDAPPEVVPLAFPQWKLKLSVPAGRRWYDERAPEERWWEGRAAGRPERVEVPAGVFEAIPVDVQLWCKGRDDTISRHSTDREWYAAGVGLVKWEVWPGAAVVLKSFTPGND